MVYDLFHGQWKLDRDGTTAHRPFGAGLGYTDLGDRPGVDAASPWRRPAGRPGRVEVEVANTGDRAGSTVVFCFAGLAGSTLRPSGHGDWSPSPGCARLRRADSPSPCRSTSPIWPCAATVVGIRSPGTTCIEVGTDAGPAACGLEVARHGRVLTVPLVLGVDSSTQSTKVELRDAEDGTLVGLGPGPASRRAPAVLRTGSGTWWEAPVPGRGRGHRRRVHDRCPRVSVAAQQHGMVVLGRDGSVLRPAKLWNDTESAPEAADMVSRLGRRRLGGPDRIGPGGRLHRHQVGLVGPTTSRTSPGSVAIGAPSPRLPDLPADGSAGDRSRGCVGHGLLRPGGRCLGGRPARGRGGSGRLDRSPARPFSARPRRPDRSGSRRPRRPRRRTGRPGRVRGPATTWRRRSASASPRARPCVSIGTSGTVYARSDRPVADPTGIVAGFADATGGFLPLACTLNATRVTGAVAALLGVTPAGLDDLALAAPAGRPWSHPPARTSTASGPRTGPTATGILAGLRPGVRREDLARARGGRGGLRAARRPRRAGRAGGDRRRPRCSWSGAAPGRRPTGGCWPTCRAGPSRCPTSARRWPPGRACRRRPRCSGDRLDAVQAAWGLGGGQLGRAGSRTSTPARCARPMPRCPGLIGRPAGR